MAKSDDFRIWSGDLFMALYSGDTAGLYRYVGHVPEFAIEAPEINELVEKGMGVDDAGDDIFTHNLELSQTFSMFSRAITQKNLVIAMMGSDTAYTQSAGATAEVDVPSNHDMWSELGGHRLDTSAPPVVTDSTGVTTYDEGDDYTVDYVAGMIKPLSTGAITDGDILKVTPTWIAITDGFKISANAVQTNLYKLKLVSRDNTKNAARGELIIYKAKINPSGPIAFINADALQQLDLTGTMLKVDGYELYDYWNY